MSQDHGALMRDYYDDLGEEEWHRLARDLPGRVSFEVHRRFLARFVRPGHRVLEVGAGPGRFTTVLADLGAQIVVTDFSPVQLELNRVYVGRTASEEAVEARELLDVCDTSRYDDGEFDVVLAYGGPLSYAFERTEEALRGLRRITTPDGVVVASVMSALGTWRHLLAGAVEVAAKVGEDANDAVLCTGDLRFAGARHVCQMFRARGRGTGNSLRGSAGRQQREQLGIAGGSHCTAGARVGSRPLATVHRPRGRRMRRARRARWRHPHPLRGAVEDHTADSPRRLAGGPEPNRLRARVEAAGGLLRRSPDCAVRRSSCGMKEPLRGSARASQSPKSAIAHRT
jgi:SAM-dependent methyltransferase